MTKVLLKMTMLYIHVISINMNLMIMIFSFDINSILLSYFLQINPRRVNGLSLLAEFLHQIIDIFLHH